METNKQKSRNTYPYIRQDILQDKNCVKKKVTES